MIAIWVMPGGAGSGAEDRTGSDRGGFHGSNPAEHHVFFFDNLGWGRQRPAVTGVGVLRGAATPRIDGLAGEGLQLLNVNVEAPCTPSRQHC